MLTDNSSTILIGFGVTGIFGVMTASKLMRNNKVFVTLLVISLALAVIQLILSLHENSFNRPNRSDTLYSPLAYVVSYNAFRFLYIQLYRMEPTYYKASWYDPEDGRRQNWLDVVVYVIPIFISLGFPIFLSIVKR